MILYPFTPYQASARISFFYAERVEQHGIHRDDRMYAEGVEQHSPGARQRTQGWHTSSTIRKPQRSFTNAGPTTRDPDPEHRDDCPTSRPRRCGTPLGFGGGGVGGPRSQGALTRPWAVMWNRFAVRNRPMKIRLHAFESASRANGPGLRAVVWFQGCTLGCPGCFNPGTHNASGGYDSDTDTLAAEILTSGAVGCATGLGLDSVR